MDKTRAYFQDYMPENICFGCGLHHPAGLRIKSYWDGAVSRCEWHPESRYRGWKELLNGGVMATLIDCHCMCTAMAAAYQSEGRSLDSEPVYRYATGSMQLRYVRPVRIASLVSLEATVAAQKGRKTTLRCKLLADGLECVSADVVAVRVYDSSAPPPEGSPFA